MDRMPVTRRRTIALLLGAALIGGCTSLADRPPPAATVLVEDQAATGWRGLASAQDIARVEGLGATWDEALAVARPRFARRIAAEGPLLEKDAALPRGAPPPGSYRCRLFRLGAAGPRAAAFSEGRSFFCHVGVEGEDLTFTQQTGPSRPAGFLYPDGDRRMIFLGALATGRESAAPAYGARAERDVVGIAERVAPFRYRLVMPRPQGSGTMLEVLELIPAVPTADAGTATRA